MSPVPEVRWGNKEDLEDSKERNKALEEPRDEKDLNIGPEREGIPGRK